MHDELPADDWATAYHAVRTGRVAAYCREANRLRAWPGRAGFSGRSADGGRANDRGREAGTLIYPGSFNPPHEGHRRIAALAESLTGRRVGWEIAVVNADKPPVAREAIGQRLAWLGSERPVWLTAAATFAEKAQLFPGATFIVGADTIARIGQPRFYGGTVRLRSAVEVLVSCEARFLVFGRVVEGVFRELADLDMPEPLAGLCTGIDGATFRCDVSSSQIRDCRPDTLPPGAV